MAIPSPEILQDLLKHKADLMREQMNERLLSGRFFGDRPNTSAPAKSATIGSVSVADVMNAIEKSLEDAMSIDLPAFSPPRSSIIEVPIITNDAMADTVIDTAACRSPGRALRRMKKGISRGHVKITVKPWAHSYRLPSGALVMHPVTAARLREALR
jgi:hypothetical protein